MAWEERGEKRLTDNRKYLALAGAFRVGKLF
jgi:hypothetical protein